MLHILLQVWKAAISLEGSHSGLEEGMSILHQNS